MIASTSPSECRIGGLGSTLRLWLLYQAIVFQLHIRWMDNILSDCQPLHKAAARNFRDVDTIQRPDV